MIPFRIGMIFKRRNGLPSIFSNFRLSFDKRTSELEKIMHTYVNLSYLQCTSLDQISSFCYFFLFVPKTTNHSETVFSGKKSWWRFVAGWQLWFIWKTIIKYVSDWIESTQIRVDSLDFKWFITLAKYWNSHLSSMGILHTHTRKERTNIDWPEVGSDYKNIYIPEDQ